MTPWALNTSTKLQTLTLGFLIGVVLLLWPSAQVASASGWAEIGPRAETTLRHDDGEMDLALTYLRPTASPGAFLTAFDLGSEKTITGLRACWTRDATFSGSSSLDFEAVLYRRDPSSGGPGDLLASASGRATAVPVSSHGGQQGANCRYYRIPLDLEASGEVLAGVRFRPGNYVASNGASGYLLGIDGDASATDGWYLDDGRWQPLHDDDFFEALGYRAFMLRLDVEEESGPTPPPPPPAAFPFLQSPAVPDFRFKVRIGGDVPGSRESSCIAETLCVSGSLPGRSELFLRMIGPRPNGYLWLNVVRFTPSEIEVWAEQRSTGSLAYYRLPALPPGNEDLRGLVDRTAFLPNPGQRRSTSAAHRTEHLEAAPNAETRATFVSPEFPGYRFTVQIASAGVPLPTRREAACLPETTCISGSIPGRSEAFLRIIGPRPNGFFHVNLVRFTPSAIDVTIERLGTGEVRRYVLPDLGHDSTTLTGRLDRAAFSTDSTPLPPDPGPENDRTLEGIDSDGDGLRDDVQRFIELRYGNHPDTVSALRQGARTALDGLRVSAANGSVIANAESMMRAFECTLAVRPSDGREAFLTLVSEVIDTEQRLREWIDYSAALDGQVVKISPPGSRVQSCGFTPRSTHLRLRLEETRQKAAACADADVIVYYINGVFNFQSAAMANAEALGSRLIDPEEQMIEISLIHNHSLLVQDLFEAVRQRAQLAVSRFLRILGGLEVMPDYMAEIYLDLARVTDAAGVVNDPELFGHVQTYKRQIAEGKKVVVVAHSQGNFFANQAWPLLSAEEQRSFGIVAVASPDSTVADGRRRWVTHRRDLVVGLIPGSLAGNVGGAIGDVLGHQFVNTYLRAGSEAERRILALVSQTIDSLDNPAGEVSDGVLTITLTWGSEPDVDLHIFEPAGEHVYYANLQGAYGFLDRDDVTSFGPEHYYASCDTLRAGTYRVGVNYFRGSGPETARIEIDAGLSNRKFTQGLTVARGSSGDNSPIPVARILVTGDRQSGFDFQVVEE